jgi:DNA invertase Pin-like site-specific DNA recombinase
VTIRKTPTSTVVTALIYTRVSSEDQKREGVSLHAQLKSCRRYVADRGWTIGGEYEDVLSGTRDDRPRYQDLLSDVRRLRAEGHSVVVVVAVLDRFGRRLGERVRCRDELKALGVAVHSVREGEVNDLMANLLAVLAEEEVRRLGERVSVAKQYIMEAGWHNGGRVPWGYRSRDATPHERAQGAPLRVLEEDPETAPFVREVFRRVANGESVRSVTAWVVTLPSAARGGRVLSYSSVRQVLVTPTYVARVGKEGTAGRWPALIEPGTWERVQARIASHKHMPRQASQRYLLSGLIWCPRCGSRMKGWARKIGRRCYQCSGMREVKCNGAVVAAPCDASVLAEVSVFVDQISGNHHVQAALRRAWQALQHPRDGRNVAVRLKQLERQAAQARDRLTRATELYVDGNLDKDGYDGLCNKARADLNCAEAEALNMRGAAISAGLSPLDVVLGAMGGWAAALHSSDVAVCREILEKLIDRVVPVRTEWGQYSAEITWTPLGEGLRRVVAAVGESAA